MNTRTDSTESAADEICSILSAWARQRIRTTLRITRVRVDGGTFRHPWIHPVQRSDSDG